MATRLACIAAALATLAALSPPSMAQQAGGEEKLDHLIGDRRPDAPKRCLTMSPALDLYIIDGTAIAYRSGTNVYVNRPRNAGVLHANDLLIDKRGELCKGDEVQIFNSSHAALRGIIQLGDFVPYKPARQASAAD